MKVKDTRETFILIQSDYDISSTLKHIGKLEELASTGCLFADIRDGEYLTVYSCPSFVPFLGNQVTQLFP